MAGIKQAQLQKGGGWQNQTDWESRFRSQSAHDFLEELVNHTRILQNRQSDGAGEITLARESGDRTQVRYAFCCCRAASGKRACAALQRPGHGS